MSNVGTWMAELAEWAWSLVPYRIVHEYEQGLRFTKGKASKALNAGVHWYWPLIGSMDVQDTVPEVIDLPAQSLTTSDEEEIVISGALQYTIKDLRKYYLGVQDFDGSLVNIARGMLSRNIRFMELSEIREDGNNLEGLIKKSLQKKVTPWGVTINDFYLTDVTTARNYRLFGDGTLIPSEEGYD